jgi:hypothetical protein
VLSSREKSGGRADAAYVRPGAPVDVRRGSDTRTGPLMPSARLTHRRREPDSNPRSLSGIGTRSEPVLARAGSKHGEPWNGRSFHGGSWFASFVNPTFGGDHPPMSVTRPLSSPLLLQCGPCCQSGFIAGDVITITRVKGGARRRRTIRDRKFIGSALQEEVPEWLAYS